MQNNNYHMSTKNSKVVCNTAMMQQQRQSHHQHLMTTTPAADTATTSHHHGEERMSPCCSQQEQSLNCLRQVIQLNHEGVILLMSGDEQAMDCFKLGLNHLKSGLIMEPMLGGQHKQMAPVCQRGTILAMPVLACPPGCLDQHEQPFYLYKNAFTVNLDYNNQEQEDLLSSRSIGVDLLSAIMIFNMALCVSIKAIRMNSSKLQERSLRLYEMCLKLVNTTSCLHSLSHKKAAGGTRRAAATVVVDPVIVLLTAACSNNLARLAYQRCDYERTRVLMNSLQYLLRVTLDARTCDQEQEDETSPSSCPFTEADIHGFTLNIMCSHPPTTASAA